MTSACCIRVRGVVQGVGFRPFVFRLARDNDLTGWVGNGSDGVEILIEGQESDLASFMHELRSQPPAAAHIAEISVVRRDPTGVENFTIRSSVRAGHTTTRVSPDLPVCDKCLAELSDPRDPRFEYPYINCTNCGPRYSILLEIPYDRSNTTMRGWAMDDVCWAQYGNPADRRFHAQPVACTSCGPNYLLKTDGQTRCKATESIRAAAKLLCLGKVVAIKGIGGYHLACDAKNSSAVTALRTRKFRKEKPFAVMARDMPTTSGLAHISVEEARLLQSSARPITLLRAKLALDGVAPGNRDIGVMLPYAPLHHLLFLAGAPDVLVMTSGNRSSEPIAYEDDDALERLAGIADAFLIGERPIARRVDDSIARVGVCGPTILRRSRGLAPKAVAALPGRHPILALGADLKNSITVVVEGQAFVSQHIGDLENYQALRAFRESIADLLSMYGLDREVLTVVHDAHPQYLSTQHAQAIACSKRIALQHHRAHIASVLAERGALNENVLGLCFDGTGYGDDGSIWGGEILYGGLSEGFSRVGHLRPALLAGGDAAARSPVQAAAGFLHQLESCPNFLDAPFSFPPRFLRAKELIQKGARSFRTTSVGRLFDCVAALLGFTREITFEGQAATWLEQLANSAPLSESYHMRFEKGQLDFRPTLEQIIEDRCRNRDIAEIAHAFHAGLAIAAADAALHFAEERGVRTVVASGGVFQNELLLRMLKCRLDDHRMVLWTNHEVPANDGGISLGQAAIAALAQQPSSTSTCAAVEITGKETSDA